jgi:outer membrane autotransporter protein
MYTDDVSTTRELVSAKLTGNWAYGHYRFRPSAELLYFHEDQKDYTNRISIYIPGQSVSLGRLTFGPEVGYHFVLASGVVLEPFVGLKGIWDFNKTDDTTLTGMVIGHDPFRGKVELGAMMWSASGMSLRATASYDGIGDGDFHAYQGQLSIAIPLN